MNVKVFYLFSWVSETKFLVQHESCESKSGLNETICSQKQEWNHDKCWCVCVCVCVCVCERESVCVKMIKK